MERIGYQQRRLTENCVRGYNTWRFVVLAEDEADVGLCIILNKTPRRLEKVLGKSPQRQLFVTRS